MRPKLGFTRYYNGCCVYKICTNRERDRIKFVKYIFYPRYIMMFESCFPHYT